MANEQVQYIDLDLHRWQDDEIDIRSQFKGRVGDVNDPIKFRFLWDHMPYDMRGATIYYGGQDPNAKTHIHKTQPQKESTRDNLQFGRCTVHFDEYTFKAPGDWDEFFIRVEKDGQVISTVNVMMHVLDDGMLAHIGEDSKGYWQDMIEIVDQFKAKEAQLEDAITKLEAQNADQLNDLTKDALDKLKSLRDQCLQQIKDAIAAIDDPKDGLMVRYQTLLTMTREIKETLKQAQFHQKANQYDTIAKMKSDVTLMDGDSAIVKGAENYNDGKGAVYAIRSKRTEDQPDGVHLIALNNGTVAERNDSIISQGYLHDHGIFPNAGTVKLGTAHLKLGDDQYPQFSVRIYQYGAGIPQPEGVDIAGGTASYDVQCRVVRIDPETVDVYLSPEHYTDYFSDYHLDSPEANCGGDSAYLYTGINCMQVQVHGAEMVRFDVATNFKC